MTDYLGDDFIQEKVGCLDKFLGCVSAFLEIVDFIGDVIYLTVANHIHWVIEFILFGTIYLPISFNIALDLVGKRGLEWKTAI